MYLLYVENVVDNMTCHDYCTIWNSMVSFDPSYQRYQQYVISRHVSNTSSIEQRMLICKKRDTIYKRLRSSYMQRTRNQIKYNNDVGQLVDLISS